MSIIQFFNVNKSYNEKKVLSNITFSVKEGEVLGILGPSGVGKSTILNLMTGQAFADSGSIRIAGKELTSKKQLDTTEMGIVSDSFGFMDRLTCHENLCLYCRIYNTPDFMISEILDKLGLSEAKNKKVRELSKGMRQRLHLARAMLNMPKMLILDEPTSDIDPKTQQQVHSLIRELKKKKVTIIITTHNMQEASDLCDKIMILNQGKIAELGTPQKIANKYELKSQIHIVKTDGEDLVLENDPASANIIKELLLKHEIGDIHMQRPDLKEVFLRVAKKDENE